MIKKATLATLLAFLLLAVTAVFFVVVSAETKPDSNAKPGLTLYEGTEFVNSYTGGYWNVSQAADAAGRIITDNTSVGRVRYVAPLDTSGNVTIDFSSAMSVGSGFIFRFWNSPNQQEATSWGHGYEAKVVRKSATELEVTFYQEGFSVSDTNTVQLKVDGENKDGTVATLTVPDIDAQIGGERYGFTLTLTPMAGVPSMTIGLQVAEGSKAEYVLTGPGCIVDGRNVLDGKWGKDFFLYYLPVAGAEGAFTDTLIGSVTDNYAALDTSAMFDGTVFVAGNMPQGRGYEVRKNTAGDTVVLSLGVPAKDYWLRTGAIYDLTKLNIEMLTENLTMGAEHLLFGLNKDAAGFYTQSGLLLDMYVTGWERTLRVDLTGSDGGALAGVSAKLNGEAQTLADGIGATLGMYMSAGNYATPDLMADTNFGKTGLKISSSMSDTGDLIVTVKAAKTCDVVLSANEADYNVLEFTVPAAAIEGMFAGDNNSAYVMYSAYNGTSFVTFKDFSGISESGANKVFLDAVALVAEDASDANITAAIAAYSDTDETILAGEAKTEFDAAKAALAVAVKTSAEEKITAYEAAAAQYKESTVLNEIASVKNLLAKLPGEWLPAMSQLSGSTTEADALNARIEAATALLQANKLYYFDVNGAQDGKLEERGVFAKLNGVHNGDVRLAYNKDLTFDENDSFTIEFGLTDICFAGYNPTTPEEKGRSNNFAITLSDSPNAMKDGGNSITIMLWLYENDISFSVYATQMVDGVQKTISPTGLIDFNPNQNVAGKPTGFGINQIEDTNMVLTIERDTILNNYYFYLNDTFGLDVLSLIPGDLFDNDTFHVAFASFGYDADMPANNGYDNSIVIKSIGEDVFGTGFVVDDTPIDPGPGGQDGDQDGNQDDDKDPGNDSDKVTVNTGCSSNIAVTLPLIGAAVLLGAVLLIKRQKEDRR